MMFQVMKCSTAVLIVLLASERPAQSAVLYSNPADYPVGYDA